MAEIPVERRSGGRAWLWLLVLAVVALLAWMLFARDEEPEPGPVPVGATPAITPDLAVAAPASASGWSTTIAT